VLSYTGDQQITLSKPKFCVIDHMGTIADFSVKPFSSKVQTPLQTSQVIETVFSMNWAGLDPLTENW